MDFMELDDDVLEQLGTGAGSDKENNNANLSQQNSKEATSNSGDGLGVDEEVTTRTRRVYAKLDATKLLSPNGIPQLQSKISKKRIFKGRGYEKRDLNKLLSEYQMWAHSLYPKANVNDFIQLCKKVGDTRQMRVHRRQWISEEKDGLYGLTSENGGARPDLGNAEAKSNDSEHDRFLRENGDVAPENGAGVDYSDDDDDNLFVSPPPERRGPAKPDNFDGSLFDVTQRNNSNEKEHDDGIPDDDELQDLMEQEQNGKAADLNDEEKRLAEELGF